MLRVVLEELVDLRHRHPVDVDQAAPALRVPRRAHGAAHDDPVDRRRGVEIDLEITGDPRVVDPELAGGKRGVDVTRGPCLAQELHGWRARYLATERLRAEGQLAPEGVARVLAEARQRGGPGEEMRRTAGTLLQHLSLLFIPAGTGVVLYGELLAREWLPLAAALAGSTFLAIAVTALVLKALMRAQDARREGEK